jgi:phosphatidylinositol-4,5-bisphosphate 3-kinase
MLELFQCLFYESHYISPLIDFLISRCIKNKKLLGNKFYWCLKVSEGNILFKDKIMTLLTQLFMMSGPDFIDYITKIKENNGEFRNISAAAKKIYHDKGKVATLDKIKELIKEKFNNGIKEFVLPVHPSYCVNGFGFGKNKFTVYGSKMVPIKLQLYSSEGQPFYVIFKIGDDLREDLMILQMFRIMDKIWMENNLDLKFSLYNVCPIDLRSGFMEAVEALPVENIQKDIGGGSILQDILYRYLQNNSYEITGEKKNLQFYKIIDNYIKSLAGYCVATGVLGIADRHPANIMIKENGLFLHIDFGHIFGNFKKKLGFKRERSVFLLTPQMAYIYVQSNKAKEFVNYCTSAFNILRANAKKFLNIMITMSSSNMPEFSTMSDVTYVKEQLKLNMNEKDASEYFIKTIKDSLNDKYRTIDNLIHNFVHS